MWCEEVKLRELEVVVTQWPFNFTWLAYRWTVARKQSEYWCRWLNSRMLLSPADHTFGSCRPDLARGLPFRDHWCRVSCLLPTGQHIPYSETTKTLRAAGWWIAYGELDCRVSAKHRFTNWHLSALGKGWGYNIFCGVRVLYMQAIYQKSNRQLVVAYFISTRTVSRINVSLQLCKYG